MKRVPLLCLALPGLALPGLGCEPQLEPIRWQPLDVEALRREFSSPTGELTEANLNEVESVLNEQSGSVETLGTFVADRLVAENGKLTGPWVMPRSLTGTSVYALLACPGSELDPGEVDFAHGHIRLDSPTLTPEVVEALEFRGDLLLTFVECELNQLVVGGEARAHLDASRALVVPELRVTPLAPSLSGREAVPPVIIEHPLALGESTVEVLLALSSGDTVVVEFADESTEASGVDGEVPCTNDEGEFNCPAP